jgi:zeaxanthin glucosyltransferase
MSRFLFVTLPLAGHVHPAAAVAAQLRRAGHEVAWVGSEPYLRPFVGEQATIFRTGMRPYRPVRHRGARALKSLWEGFVVPFARFLLPAVEKAVRAYEPDVLVVDQHALAGAIVADRFEIRWATLCPGAMELTQPFRRYPKVDAWIRGHLAALAPDASADLRFSPHLVIAFTGTALTGTARFPDHYVLVGPAIGERPPVPEFPWRALRTDRRLVLVSVGTMVHDMAVDFHRRIATALDPLREQVQAIVVTQPGILPDPAPHLLVTPRAPLLELMPRLSAVICHAGHNTTTETLAHGVPVVVAPITNDQPIVAGQVVAAGAGVRVHFGRSSPEQLRAALATVLDDPSYGRAAERVRDSFTAAGGAPAAAARLARLAYPAASQSSS